MGGVPTTYRQQAPAPAKTELAEAIVFEPDEVKTSKKKKKTPSKLAITSNAKNTGTNTGVNKGYS